MKQGRNEYGPDRSMVQGDDKECAYVGSETGVTDSYGADLSPTATNRIGSIAGSTKSDAQDPA